MKKILFILICLSLLLAGCGSILEADTTPETAIPITVTETVIEYVEVEKIVEVENTDRVEQLQAEVRQYQDLIANLNELLSCVYYGYASNDNYIIDGFTAFSIEYNDKYYIITAGHCVEQQGYGKFNNFKFKVNGEWIYPKLLSYAIGRSGDYAIFYSDMINKGLKINIDDTEPVLYLGYNNKVTDMAELSVAGDSGSPVINVNGEAIGIRIYDTGNYTEFKNIDYFK